MPISERILIDQMKGMSRFPDQFFDWCFADPSYGINAGNMNYVTNGKKRIKQRNGGFSKVRTKAYGASDFDTQIPGQDYFDELRRVSKNQIIFGINYFSDIQLPQAGRIIWDKMIPAGVGFSSFEVAYCSSIQHELVIKLLWSGMMQARSLKDLTSPQPIPALRTRRVHPTQKPVLLYVKALELFAKPGDKILDPGMGSQSSAVACWKMGFDYWGFERDPAHFQNGEKFFREQTSEPLFFNQNQ